MDKALWDKTNTLLTADIDPVYREVASRFGEEYRDSRYLPWLLARYMTVDQARVVLELPDPNWEPSLGDLNVSGAFSERLGIKRDIIDKGMLSLFEKGYIYPTRRGPRPPRTFVGWMDIQHNTHYRDELGEEWYAALGMMMDYELLEQREKETEERVSAGLPPLARVIPRWRSIENVEGKLPSEDIREILKANNTFGLINCACRQRYPDRECKSPEEVCLTLGKAAEYNIRRRAARSITLDQALDVYDRVTKDYSLITVCSRGETPGDVSGIICNCHADCCVVLRIPMVIGSKYPVWEHYAKSRYRATVDLDKCTGCGLCASERCQFGAVQMRYYPGSAEKKSYTSEEICMGCGCCVETCPAEARGMKIVEPPESVTKMPDYQSRVLDQVYVKPAGQK